MKGGIREGAGRHPIGDAPRSVRVSVFMTVDEVARLDTTRGDVTRSEFLVTQAGIRAAPEGAVSAQLAQGWLPAPKDAAGLDALPDGTQLTAYMTSRLLVKRGKHWRFEDGDVSVLHTSVTVARASRIQPDRMMRLPCLT